MNLAEKIIEAKQERANVYEGIKSILSEFENKEMEQTKKDELSKLESQFDALNEKIVKNEKNLERERIIGEKQDQTKQNPLNDREKEVKNAFVNYLREANSNAMSVYNALQQDNPTQAGYLVAPQQFMSELIQEKNNLTFMRQIARVLPTLSKAQSMGFPKRTARMSTFAWGTEIKAPAEDTSLAFGKREFIAKPATGGILVSKTLARNSAINIDSYIRSEMAYNQATNEEQAFMTGDGAGKPLGVFTASADGISTSRDISTGNTATEIKFDGLFEAKYAIKEQYQQGLSWAFHRDAVKQIAKLKDSDGQYIWQQSVSLGTPDMLMGYPVRMSEYAPNTFTTGLYVGILGNFKEGYWICDSLSMEMQALVELYALTNQIYYIGRHETDGMPVLEECFSRLKLA
jgi:HK97 family phage major capsid protein